MAAAAAAFGLGVVEREIGVLEQVFGGRGVLRTDRDADRGADLERLLAKDDRPVKQTAQLLADHARLERGPATGAFR